MLNCKNLTIIGGTVKGAIEVTEGTLELKGVKMNNPRCVTVSDNGVCNIDKDCVLEGDGSNAVVVVWNGTLNTEGTIVCHGENYAISGNGTQSGDINIMGGFVKSEEDSAIYLPHKGTCNISGGVIEGKDGIYQKSGALNVSGGNIKGFGDAVYSYYGNGSNAIGNGITIDFCGYPGGDPVLNVTGGTIESEHKKMVGVYVPLAKKNGSGSYPEDSAEVQAFLANITGVEV